MVEESESEDEEEFKDSWENLPPRNLVEPSSTHEQVLLPANVIASSQPSSSSSCLTSQSGISQDIMGEGCHEEVIDHVDLIEDMKFYQDLDYQNTYKALHAQQVELQGKYSAQAYLIKEASAAIKAAEAKVQGRHQELLDAQCNHQVEIKSAMNKAVEHYQVQLSTAQSNLQTQDHEHQLAIQKLQNKIQSLEVSLASWVNLPSVWVTQSHDGTCLRNEVFNFIPGTVNKNWGMAQYNSQDQAFFFPQTGKIQEWDQ